MMSFDPPLISPPPRIDRIKRSCYKSTGMLDFHYFSYPLNGILMIAIPILLGYLLARRFALPSRIWWIGAITFILSQVGHIPFNVGLTLLFERGILPHPSPEWRLLVNASVLGLSAGLWEELARFSVLRWWAKDIRSWRKGVFLGAGHGGIEAISLGVLVLFQFFNLLAIRNIELSTLVPADQLNVTAAQIAAYWSAPWYATLLGAVERLFSITVHISLSVLVLQFFLRRQIGWLPLAILWHAIIDGLTVVSINLTNPYLTEVIIGIFALISLLIVWKLNQPPFDLEELVEIEEPVSGQPLPEITRKPLKETSENLEDTRYIR